jgi:hypothetical protein
MPEQLSRRLLLKNLLGASAAGVVSLPMQGLRLPQGNQPTGVPATSRAPFLHLVAQ